MDLNLIPGFYIRKTRRPHLERKPCNVFHLKNHGIGVFSDVKDAVAKCLHVDRTIVPDPSAAEKYNSLYAVYRQIHDALAPVYQAAR